MGNINTSMSNNCSRNQRKGSRNQRKGSRNQRKGSRNQRKGSRNQRKRSIKKNRRQYGGQVCSNDGTTSSTKPFAHLNSVNNNNGDTTPSPSYIFLGENNQEIKMYAPASNNNVALLASDDQ